VPPVQKKPVSGGTGPSTLLRPCSQPVAGDSSPGGTGFQPVGSELRITRRNLPHWQVGGFTDFVTFRTKEAELPVAARQQVLAACRHFDGRRFTLWVAVVMPDHVLCAAAHNA